MRLPARRLLHVWSTTVTLAESAIAEARRNAASVAQARQVRTFAAALASRKLLDQGVLKPAPECLEEQLIVQHMLASNVSEMTAERDQQFSARWPGQREQRHGEEEVVFVCLGCKRKPAQDAQRCCFGK